MGISFMKEVGEHGRTGGYYISPPCPSAGPSGQKRTGGQSVRFQSAFLEKQRVNKEGHESSFIPTCIYK